MMAYISGEENRDIINKAKWRIRHKTILGKKLRASTEVSREVKTVLGCKILNRFLELGRCESMLVT